MEENKNHDCCGCGEHEHEHEGCGCGCGGHDEEETLIYVTFEDENEEVPCAVLDIFECEGREYIAIVPADQVESEEAEVLFYRYSEDGEEVKLDDIETDEEWDAVASLFDSNFFADYDEE